MPLPGQLEPQSGVLNSSEQVVPLSSSETDHFMEADLPDENGAASVKAAVIQQLGKKNNSLASCYQQEKNKEENSNESILQFSSQKDLNLGDKENNLCSEVYMSQDDDVSTGMNHTPYSCGNTLPRIQTWCSQYQQLEGEIDMGYSSHSACSSCQPESQSDSAQNMNHTDPEECFEGDDEMEDLLFHFDRFFKNRYDELLTEQGMHVRQIVTRALKTGTDRCCCNTNIVEMTDKSTQTNTEKFTVPSIMFGDSLCHACGKQKTTPMIEKSSKPILQSGSSLPRDKILLQLLAQICSVTNLLQRKEYKT